MSTGNPKLGVNLLFIKRGLRGGTVTYPRELLRALAAGGQWDITIYVQRGAFHLGQSYEHVRYREVSLPPSVVVRVGYEQLWLPWVVMRDRIDVLFSPGFVSPLLGRFKKVVTIHDLYYKKFPDFVRKWQGRYWRAMVPLSLRACDRAIVVSDTTAADTVAAYPWAAGKLERIFQGCPFVVKPRERGDPGSAFVLVVGNLTPNKNIQVVLQALRILASRGVSCPLKVVGADIYGHLRRSLESVGEPVHVELLQGVSDEDLTEYYRSALCTIVPSIYEGFGLPVLEAMAHGCPVITTNGGALREVGGDGALYFRPDSPEGLAACIARLVEDAELRKGLVERGYRNAQRFSWEQTARETARVLRSALREIAE